jgi:hypothetical protein
MSQDLADYLLVFSEKAGMTQLLRFEQDVEKEKAAVTSKKIKDLMVSGRLYSVYTVIICIRVKAIDPPNHNCNRTAEKWIQILSSKNNH